MDVQVPTTSTEILENPSPAMSFINPDKETRLDYSILKTALDSLPDEAFMSRDRLMNDLQKAIAISIEETKDKPKPKWTFAALSLELEIDQTLKLPLSGEVKLGKVSIGKYGIFIGAAWVHCKARQLPIKKCIEDVLFKIINSEIPEQFN